ncbi:hypothetical protein Kuja_1820 [Vibrio phage vB_VchM_Kuja]|uniref:Uncharacterized protein n=1 Tax=Vibrio phage vB_VchM_Kuja TaxID=2686437 RepID=A0A6B9J7Y9_9CAUD|nr:hypothetical protein HWC83_gp053 [Vibrio phage vB_VchM_Kuja]QGZ16174.1 hypothetical protein Kuja_1820 [Vibrio phage vB_VchM_Kuja]
MIQDMKVEGQTEWVRKGSTQGLVINTSKSAYEESIAARRRALDLQAKLEKLEKMLGEQND